LGEFELDKWPCIQKLKSRKEYLDYGRFFKYVLTLVKPY